MDQPVTLDGVIDKITSMEGCQYPVDQRLDALVTVLQAAYEGRRDLDAYEVLLDAGIGRSVRKALEEQILDQTLTLDQVTTAVAAAKLTQQRPAHSSG